MESYYLAPIENPKAMRTIIVATDYSEEGQNALEYGAALAKESGPKVVLYNSYQLSVHASNGLVSPETINRLVNENKETLQHLAARISKKYQVPTEYYSKYCLVEEGLTDLADQLKPDLVILGMRSNSLEYKLLGNTTTSIIQEAKFPVLVVPGGAKYKKPEKILFACDYLALPGENPLALLKILASNFNAEVQVFHVGNPSNSKSKAIVEEIDKMLAGVNHSYREVPGSDVLEGIAKGIEDFEADLLLMAHHKQGFWSSLFSSSRTRAMSLKVNIPLLALEG